MKAMILAAGRGERLRPLTDHTPKPLVRVRGKPLLQHHLERLQAAGFTDLVINVCWLKQQIMTFIDTHQSLHPELNITVVDEGRQALETGGGMLNALPILGEKPFLAVNADVFTDVSFNRFGPLSDGALAHLMLVPNPEHNSGGDFGLQSGWLNNKQPGQPTHTYSGIGVFHPQLLAQQTAGTAFSVTPLIRQAADQQRITAELFTGDWNDVGTHERLGELNRNRC